MDVSDMLLERDGANRAARVMTRYFADLLAEALAESDMSQRDIAQILGVTEGRVSQIRAAEGHLTIATVARMLYVLGYEVDISINRI